MSDKVDLRGLFDEIDTSFANLKNGRDDNKFDELPDGIYEVQVKKVELIPKHKKLLWVFKVEEGNYKGSTTSLWTWVTGEFAFVTKTSMYYAGYAILDEKEAELAGVLYKSASDQILDIIDRINLDIPKLRIEIKTNAKGYQNTRILGKSKLGIIDQVKSNWSEEAKEEVRVEETPKPTAEEVRNIFR